MSTGIFLLDLPSQAIRDTCPRHFSNFLNPPSILLIEDYFLSELRCIDRGFSDFRVILFLSHHAPSLRVRDGQPYLPRFVVNDYQWRLFYCTILDH